MGRRAVKAAQPQRVEEMNLDEKIGLLNAFRKIRSKSPRVSDPKIHDLVKVLYQSWIDEQMLKIIQPGSESSSLFTPDEAHALKVLAQTILQRQSGGGPQGVPTQPAPQAPQFRAANPQSTVGDNPNPERAAPLVQRKGLNPGVDTNRFRNAQANFLQELSAMEQVDPDELTNRLRRGKYE